MHLVPFLGVVMLLLTFFLLGSSMVMQSGVRVQPPASSSLLEPMLRAQIITLSAGRQPQIYFNDRPVSLAELKAALQEPSTGPRQVLIRADELAAVGALARVRQAALENGYEVVEATTPLEPGEPLPAHGQ